MGISREKKEELRVKRKQKGTEGGADWGCTAWGHPGLMRSWGRGGALITFIEEKGWAQTGEVASQGQMGSRKAGLKTRTLYYIQKMVGFL